jgi:hypothetical protein
MTQIHSASIPINDAEIFTKKISVCTLVTKPIQYNDMVESFINKGFQQDCEFLYINNIDSNNFDAYSSIRKFLLLAKSEYIIFCHQDILAIDTFETLNNCLITLNNLDSNWAIAANAGGKHIKGVIKYLVDADGNKIVTPDLPQQVFAIDENFFIVKKSALLSISNNLNGFHFYATDMCLIADLLGYKSYVIPYLVKHLSHGNYDAHFQKQMKNARKKYQKAYRAKFLESPSYRFYISSSSIKNLLFNNSFTFFWVKIWYRVFE